MKALKLVEDFSSDPEKLPEVVEAEEAVIGGLLLGDPESFVRVKNALRPEFFGINAYSKTYEAIESLADKGKPIDLITVAQRLREMKLLDKVGGQAFLARTMDRTVSAVNIDRHAELVRDYHYRRELIRVGHEIYRIGHKEPNPTDALAKATELLTGVTEGLADANSTAIDVSTVLVDVFEEFSTKLENPDSGSEIRTGYTDLDNMLYGGLRPGSVTVVASRPGMGKSALVAIDLLHRISRTYPEKQNVLVSLEMSESEVGYRYISRATADVDRSNPIPAGELKRAKFNDAQLTPIYEAFSAQNQLRVLIDSSPVATLDGIRAKLWYARSLRADGLGVLVVDYLQLMGDPAKDEGMRRYEIEKLSRGFKIIAQEFNIPVILLSQLSRGVENRNNKRPQLSDLRESGSIEQDADNVIMLYRDEYYDPASPDKGLVEVLVRKARDGRTGEFKLLGMLAASRFDNYAPAEIHH